MLFVLAATWCTLALIYNPGYRPFFLKPKTAARLATRGPYALVRHPRYAGEAALNFILAAFTGAWLPLLGVLGWPALRGQAQVEEEWLLMAAPESYRGVSGLCWALSPTDWCYPGQRPSLAIGHTRFLQRATALIP